MSDMTGKISDAESEVMKVIWDCGAPVTEAMIRDILGKKTTWDPQTIKTLLRRLLFKGAVTRKRKEVFYYTPVLSRDDFDRDKTQELVNKVFGGDARTLLSTLINNEILSEDDIDELKEYWKERKAKK